MSTTNPDVREESFDGLFEGVSDSGNGVAPDEPLPKLSPEIDALFRAI